MDAVTVNGLQHSAVSTSSQLEADGAVAEVADMVSSTQPSCELTQPATAAPARTVSTADTGRELSLSDGLMRREDRHRSGNLAAVSEESGPKSSSYQGSVLLV